MQIVVDGEVFTSEVTTLMVTEFYLEHDGVYFPHYKWTDFTDELIGMWTYKLFKYRDRKNVSFILYFMDGPYWLDVYKDANMRLEIKCVHNGLHNRSVEFEFQCEYADFLKAIYEATKSLNYLLYKYDLHKGKYEPTFNQTIRTINELKAVIQSCLR